MYFPYLRGKQFELIALRELSSLVADTYKKVSPIIEPVKNSSTLRLTITELNNQKINFNIVVNPTKGDLIDSTVEIINLLQTVIVNNNFQLAFIIDEKTNFVEDYLDLIKHITFDYSGVTLIHNAIKSNIKEIIDNLNTITTVVNNIIYFNKTSRRYYREFSQDTRIGLDDFFSILPRNADYLSVPDSQFSEEHIYYKDDGFKGFSDFLTIGDIYLESGFLPYAVAIHLSYIDEENKIRIKHFVSDSNEDTSDSAGKFAEALNKLISWCDGNPSIDSYAVNQFRMLHDNGAFPGLGTIKKLSIMHHIELVSNMI